MVKHIGNSLGNFLGPSNQTRCFVHTVNLIVKSILKPFDTAKSKEPKSTPKDVRAFEDVMAEMYEQEKGSDGNDNDDKEEEEEDEEDKDEEGEDKDDELAMRLDPIRSMLQKVSLRPIDPNPNSWLTNGKCMKLRNIAFTMKNSTTILLPAWNKMLPRHGLSVCMMLQDVSTRWNSTFDMLEFAIQYHVAIDAMTAVREFDLRKYELGLDEWKIAMELRDVLKVSNSPPLCFWPFTLFRLDFQRCNTVLFSWHPQPRHCCPCDGCHQ